VFPLLIHLFWSFLHQTTANALSCALYCFAKYPELQERARSEIIEVVGPLDKNDRFKIPSYEEQKRLNFLTAFIMETLRYVSSIVAFMEA
jgi:cytochrome P450